MPSVSILEVFMGSVLLLFIYWFAQHFIRQFAYTLVLLDEHKAKLFIYARWKMRPGRFFESAYDERTLFDAAMLVALFWTCVLTRRPFEEYLLAVLVYEMIFVYGEMAVRVLFIRGTRLEKA